ncbi:MAG TPA: Coenzyme F420 hydrogenase/dehydrogenase, beta subunit C-terminal domain [Sphingomicrobium sp.]|jgi:coenzyme F420-reducing hydrogenase beta subunit|nr:Coenzyme F420 hydrogenase/dehydrogenase, beta subunit C-terminal domain [Sphingomicrobium sp.]
MRHLPDLVSPREIVDSGLCIGCGACAAAQMRWDRDGFLKPDESSDAYDTRSDTFSRQCPFSPAAPNEDAIAAEQFADAPHADTRIGRFEAAYVGYAREDPFRRQASSGGMTSWVAAELLRTNMIDAVAHVSPADPQTSGAFFEYRISRSLEALSAGAKSRYYPIELSRVLAEIRATPGRYAIIGIPCFIKAIHLLRRIDPVLHERVTHTLGLFCGHMKSAAMVESFAWQLGTEVSRVRALDYRIKDEHRPANWYRAHIEFDDGSSRERDWWHLADGDWGAGFLQNPACDWCDDVVAETADISFGDAWVEPYSSDGRGTNVVIVRTKELKQLIEVARADGRLELKDVDAEFIARTQAAGLRHRRDGLAYRLTWRRHGIVPHKRIAPSADLPLRRRLVYRLRYAIARWSHPILRLARRLGMPRLYTAWARIILRLYQSLTWSRGWVGKVFDALMPQPER